jgi:hypothetical protein
VVPARGRDDAIIFRRDTCTSLYSNFKQPSLNTVIASEAKQSIGQQERKSGLLRRFAPRNDGEMQFRILAA